MNILKSTPAFLLGILGLNSLARGILHIVWHDSGAGSIAGMNLSYPNAADVILLLGAVGVLQAAIGVFYIYFALRVHQVLGFILGVEVIRSTLLVVMEYTFKMPVNPVPGRYIHIAVMITAFVALVIHLYNSRTKQA